MYRPQRQSEKRAFLISAAVISAVVLLGILALLLVKETPPDPRWSGYSVTVDPLCEVGPLPEQTDDPSPVAEGSARYRMNRAVWYPSPRQEGTVLFQSDSGNGHLLKISYWVGERCVYESRFIPPGSHIARAKLNESLLAGQYEAVCRIELFDRQTAQSIGFLQEPITVTVDRQ